MTLWRADPDRAASALVEASVSDLAIASGARLLLVEAEPRLADWLRQRDHDVTLWRRRLMPGGTASCQPPAGPFDVALLRLPKTKDELEMSAHLACGVLRDGGRLFIYGGNDEGVRTAAKRLASLSADIETVATRQHGRIIALTVRADVRHWLKPTLAEWRLRLRDDWVTYPGLFAEGGLDAGTALLIENLPSIPSTARVLDYGCGPGMLAAAVRERAPQANLDALDHDAVALTAASENVAGVRAVLGCDLSAVGDRRYDLIVSNPPLHAGFKEDHGALMRLLADAPRHLNPGGSLMLVVQRRVPLQDALRPHYRTVELVAETGTYRVWSARA